MTPRADPRTSPHQRAELHRLLSAERLTSYSAAAGRRGDAASDELDLYVFNMALASGFLGPLHLLEVVVRNSIHLELVVYTGREDWWESPRLQLVRRQIQEIERASLRCRSDSAGRTSASSPNDVVAALEFGFWCGLLGRGRPAAGADYERDLWQPAIQKAFPQYRGTRGDLARHLNSMRVLRNRISHHEPIHIRDNRHDFDQLIRLIDHISRDIARWVDDRSTVNDTIVRAPGSPAPIRHF